MKEKFSVALAAGMVVVFAAFGGGASASGGKIVDPADFGFSPDAAPEVNAKALQKALDGGGKTVRVARPGVYGLDRNVYVDSDTTLEFVPGAVLKKMKPYQHVLVNRGAYSYGCDSNIVVRNLEIRVNKMEAEPAPDAIVAGNASADIVFDNVKSEKGPILSMWRWSSSVQGTPLYATVHNITVTNCVFDGKSRMDFNFFDPDGKGTLTLRGNQAHRPVKVRAPGGIRISGDTPFEK